MKGFRQSLLSAFGWEYAYSADWGTLHRLFIRLFGIVDLPLRIRARAVLAVLAIESTEGVLDVGAGTGVFAFCLTRDPRCRAMALDIDARRVGMIKSVARCLGRGELSAVCGDEQALTSLPAGEFSTVLAVEVLQYCSNLPLMLRQLQERLRPGGVLIAHVPIRDTLWPFEKSLFSDAALEELVTGAGLGKPQIRKTFGRSALALCAIFSWCVARPVVLAAVYPLLLLAIALTPTFVEQGEYRLVVARKPFMATEDQ